MSMCKITGLFIFVFLNTFRLVSSKAFQCKDESSKSFYIDVQGLVEGKVIDHFETPLLTECVERCKKTSQCKGANFVVTTEDDTICLLVDTNQRGLMSETPVESAVMYAVRSYCDLSLNSANTCQNRVWMFERYAQTQMEHLKYVIEKTKGASLDECLSDCTGLVQCEAIAFSPDKGICQLLSIAPHGVHGFEKYFSTSQSTDVYERNCVQRHIEMSKCTFLHLKNAGFEDLYDVRLNGVWDADTCERICWQWQKGFCRSYTFNAKTNQCFISHLAPRFLGRRPLDNMNPDLFFGELDDCMHFWLNCKKGSLSLGGKSVKMFVGTLKSKKGSDVMCQKRINGAYEWETELTYGDCGVEKKKMSPGFSGTILVKDGNTDMITIKDKVIQVNCRMHDETEPQVDTQFLSFQLEVAENDTDIHGYNILPTQKTSLPPLAMKARKQRYRLEVLNDDGQVTNTVNVGGKGYLLITADRESERSSDFIVGELSAEDSIQKKTVTLIDSKGCVVNNSAVYAISKPTKNQLRIDIIYEGFVDQAQITFHAVVKPCTSECMLQCNARYFDSIVSAKNKTRQRRDIESGDTRSFNLEQDVYPIRTHTSLLVINNDSSKSLDGMKQQKYDVAKLSNIVKEALTKKSDSPLPIQPTTLLSVVATMLRLF